MTNGRSELEKRIIFAEEAGQKWADLHAIAMQLNEDKANYLAALINDLEAAHGSTVSEKRLERLARGSKQYREYIKNMCIAKGEELRAKVRYENARDYFEAGRSQESTEREKMKTLKFIP
jgi:gamma-glutamyl phosphate reductase